MDTGMASDTRGHGSGTAPGTTGHSSGHVFTLAEAAAAVERDERTIRRRAERGTLRTSPAVRDGRVVRVVELDALTDAYPDLADALRARFGHTTGTESGPPGTRAGTDQGMSGSPALPAASSAAFDAAGNDAPAAPGLDMAARLEALQQQLSQALQKAARLEGELSAASRVEASLQRYSDRLEAKIEAADRQLLTLARSLGQAEARVAQLQAPRGWLRRLIWR